MTYETFLEWIPDMVQSQLGDGVEVRLHTIYKNNNVRRNAICVMEEGCNVSPTIYLERYYQQWKDGVSLDKISSEICKEYEANRCGKYVNIASFCQFETMKDRIVYKLIHYDRNWELLQQIPHRRFLDLAVVYYLLLEDPFLGNATVLIQRQQMQMWNVEEETLYQMASCNTKRILGNIITPMRQVIRELLIRDMGRQLASDVDRGICTLQQVEQWSEEVLEQILPKEQRTMFVMSNHKKYLGAVSVLDQEMLDDFAGKLDGGFYVIPSSIHEMILVPETESLQWKDMRLLLAQINGEEDNVQEYLSDQIYYYDRQKGLQMMGDPRVKESLS